MHTAVATSTLTVWSHNRQISFDLPAEEPVKAGPDRAQMGLYVMDHANHKMLRFVLECGAVEVRNCVMVPESGANSWVICGSVFASPDYPLVHVKILYNTRTKRGTMRRSLESFVNFR